MRYYFKIWRHIVIGLVLLLTCLTGFGFSLFNLHPDTPILLNQLSGVADNLAQEILPHINHQVEGKQQVMVTVSQIRSWYQINTVTIKQILASHGYFSPIIHSSLELTEKHYWLAKYSIQLGPRITIKNITVHVSGSGSFEFAFTQYLEHLPLHSGDPLEMAKYQEIKQHLFDISNNLGYIKSVLIKNEVRVDLTKNSAVIDLQFNTGDRFYFGNFQFETQAYDQSFLVRFLHKVKPGQVFSNNRLFKLQQDMNNSNYFQQVTITPQQNNAVNHLIPVKIEVTPYKPQQYLFGLGYGTDTRFRGTVGMNFRHLNNYGHQFKTLVQISQKNNSAIATYLIPGNNPMTDQYAISGSILNDFPRNLESRTQKFALSKINNHKAWQRTIALNLQRDIFTTTRNNKLTTTTFYPSINFLRIFADQVVRPTNGLSININLSGAQHRLGSQISFVRGLVNAKFIRTLTPDTRLLLRGSAGLAVVDDETRLPLSMRFFAGGTDSVRGYDYEDIGPGVKLLVGSAEIQQRVMGDWYVGAFVDTGTAKDRLANLVELKKAAGVSLIYLTNIGPFELSVARPIRDPNNHHWHIQFTMGPEL
jgi:translocation and assembly module TamA